METCVWPLEPRRGHLIQRASHPSPWRWTPTWWQLKTPTNLEVRPLAGTRGLHHCVKLWLYRLHASLHPISSFQLRLCHSCFQTVAFAATIAGSLYLSVILCARCHFFMLLRADWELLWQHIGHLSSRLTVSVVSWSWLNLFCMCVFFSKMWSVYACFLRSVTGSTAWMDILTHSFGFELPFVWISF